MPADVTVVLGAQWGDEGKGKLVDALLAEGSIDLCCRCQVSKGNFYFNLNNRPKIILIQLFILYFNLNNRPKIILIQLFILYFNLNNHPKIILFFIHLEKKIKKRY